jgi:uncharacterized membrane protein
MFGLLREHGRVHMTAYLAVLSGYCLLLSVFRVFVSETRGYLFLNWNLFLALIPWLLTSFAVLRRLKSRIAILFLVAAWLLFFPNSLYILTDLVHLRDIKDAPLWLDLILVFSFAWAGLCYGFVSLADIGGLFRSRLRAGGRTVSVLSAVLLFLAAFGVYIGRFLRWNSWDLFGSPARLLGDVLEPFADPPNNLRFWGFTFLMGILLNFLYAGFRLLGRGYAKPTPRHR